jgi:hypothetical protein
MIKLKNLLGEIFEPTMLEEDSSEFQIFCDMDGVLVNFDDGVKELTNGLSFEQYKSRFGEAKLWEMINKKGSTFWARLLWMPDGQNLWDSISHMKPTPIILTSGATSKAEYSSVGKKEWCERLSGSPQVIVVSEAREKQKYAGKNRILIDDYEKNIQQWNAKGGIGILHKNTADTLRQLNRIYKNTDNENL